MLGKLSIFAVAAAATPEAPVFTREEKPQLETSAFQEFKASFGKIYADDKLESHRFDVFKANHEFIQSTNALNPPYRLAVNEFTDLTLEEFASIYMGALPVPEGSQVPLHNYSGASLADSLDWVSKGAVTPVKNQGQCGSCWTFSTTGALEGAYQIAKRELVSFSEQQLVDCVVNIEGCCGGCGGGWPRVAMQWAESHDVCTEDGYTTYHAKQGTCSSCTTVGMKSGILTSWKQVSKDSASLMDAVNGQPVSICLDASGAFMFYKNGVLTQLCGGTQDHAVLLVGYGTDTSSGLKYWKVKNSWGTGWGESGYIRLVRDHDGKGTLDYVQFGGFSNKDSSGHALHPFLNLAYTDSGATANGEKVYVAYYGSVNTGYALYKCPQNYWIIMSVAGIDYTKCTGYAYTAASKLKDLPTGWMEYTFDGKWAQEAKAGVTSFSTVSSECGVLKNAVYPIMTSATTSVVV